MVKQAVVIMAFVALLVAWMTSAPRTGGSLKIENRTNSEVTVNEANTGYCCTVLKGDYCICALAAGTHKLRIACNDSGNRFERTVEIKDGETTTLSLNSGC